MLHTAVQFKFKEIAKVPPPRELYLLCQNPPCVSEDVPSEIPCHNEGVFLTAVPARKARNSYDDLFSTAKPWSCQTAGGTLKKSASAHYEYFRLDKGSLKRQSIKDGAIAQKMRTTHSTDLISKVMFVCDDSSFSLCLIILRNGWQDALKVARTQSTPYLSKRVTDSIRSFAGSGPVLDADRVKQQVERVTGVPTTREQAAKGAILGVRYNKDSPAEPRTVTMCAIDVDSENRMDYINGLDIAVPAKEWAAEHDGQLQSISLQQRLKGLVGQESITTNGVESINGVVSSWIDYSRTVPEAMISLENRMKSLDRDLARSITGESGEIVCIRTAAGGRDDETEKRMKDLGFDQVFLDNLDALPMFDKIEAVFGPTHCGASRKLAASLITHSFTVKNWAVHEPSTSASYIVDLTRAKFCNCSGLTSLCGHLLKVWSCVDVDTATESIKEFLLKNEARQEHLDLQLHGAGSKSGKARRRGSVTTKTANNLKVGNYIPNPYKRYDPMSDNVVLTESSDDEDGACFLADILHDTNCVLDD